MTRASRAALVAGATGLVGRHLVRLLARDPGVPRISLPLRRVPDWVREGGDKLRPTLVDFERLDLHPAMFDVAQVFVCLGTTRRQAGSRSAFRRVDFDYALDVARRGADGGADDLFVVSSSGANPRSPVFYSRVKGELEEAVAALPYRSIVLFRPSLLLGEREAPRAGERWAGAAARLVDPLLRGPLARYRAIAAADVAAAMAAAARSLEPGVRRIESDEILRMALAERPARA